MLDYIYDVTVNVMAPLQIVMNVWLFIGDSTYQGARWKRGLLHRAHVFILFTKLRPKLESMTSN